MTGKQTNSKKKKKKKKKTVFSTLLKQFNNELNKKKLISRFKKCGIYPLDRNQVMNRLPSEGNPREGNLQIDECLVDILKSTSGKNDAAPKRGKKISFAPGKGISVSTKKDTESEGEQESESEDESDMDIESEDESQDTDFSEDDNENHDPKQSSKAPVKGSIKVSDWVVVKYDIASSSKSKSSIQYFVGQILEVISDAAFMITFSDDNIPNLIPRVLFFTFLLLRKDALGTRLQYSHRCAQYKWPSLDDVDTCDFDNIAEVLPHGKMTKRGAVTF